MKTAIAHDTGFYGGRRVRPGERFTVADDAQARWFTDAEPAARVKPAEPKPPKTGKVAEGKAGGEGPADDLA